MNIEISIPSTYFDDGVDVGENTNKEQSLEVYMHLVEHRIRTLFPDAKISSEINHSNISNEQIGICVDNEDSSIVEQIKLECQGVFEQGSFWQEK